jgi:D-glycero-D-manno-heptose 1,7-bisphosphate phosphatase
VDAADRSPEADYNPRRRAVFIDRDGVICENRSDYVKSWEEFTFLPGTLDALTHLASSPFHIVIITNQSVINRHLTTPEAVDSIHTHMLQAITERGGRVDAIYTCPHRPDEHCTCRKPKPGLLLRAAADAAIDLGRSYLIGDAEADIEAGLSVGCRCYLALTGRGHQQLAHWSKPEVDDFTVVPDLSWAVAEILHREQDRLLRPLAYPEPVQVMDHE